MTPLPTVRSGLLSNSLDDQVLVYDPRADRVHLLDETTSCVMQLLEERTWTVEGIIAELSRRTDNPPSPDLVLLAIEELQKADLLDTHDGIEPERTEAGMRRRDALRKAALAGATAFAIPAIVSLMPSAAYGQSSCFVVNTCCTSTSQCCPGTICVSDPGRCGLGGSACHFG